MGRFATISASMAAVMAITSIDLIGFASSAAARGHSSGFSSRSVSHFSSKSFAQHNKTKTDFRQRLVVPKNKGLNKFTPKHTQKFVPKVVTKHVPKFIPKYVPKGSAKSLPFQQNLVQKKLPLIKPVAANGQFKARLGLPPNLKPKLTLVKAPKLLVVPKFQPFIQRHWKSAFFWVAVAGIGYLTIPEFYYDRWVSYVDEEDPDYDRAVYLLSLAALEEEEGVVRISKPADVPYRYTAPVAPPPTMIDVAENDPAKKVNTDGQPVCTLKPFVDRQWAQAFVWVQIPDVGNVTVPEQRYDQFVNALNAAPPNYETACTVLAEAAAADTVTTAQVSSVE